MNGIPPETQKLALRNVIRACGSEGTSREPNGPSYIWRGMDLVKKIPNVDAKILSNLQDRVVHFFTKNPHILEKLPEDRLSRLMNFVPKEGSIKLCAAVQKQCKAYKDENVKQQ